MRFEIIEISLSCNCYSYTCPLSLGISLPALQLVGDFGQLAAMEGGLLDASALLAAVVVEQTEGVFAQNQDGNKVAGGEEGHEEVDNVPTSDCRADWVSMMPLSSGTS